MLRRFDERSHQLERLDTGDYTPGEYALWQREARLINRFLGDTRALKMSLKKELRKIGPGRVSILDVGAGAGELLRAAGAIVSPREVFLVGSDLSPQAADTMSQMSELGIHSVQADALRLPFADASFDFTISSLFLHHLGDEEAIVFVREMARVAAKRFIVIDLHRYAAAYYL